MVVATIDPDCDVWDGLISVDDEGSVGFENLLGPYPHNTPFGVMYLDDAEKVAKAIMRLRQCWELAWDERRSRGIGRYGPWPTVDPETLAVTWVGEV